ncbi:hypothetical protein HDE_00605 [Halotydeus destructor]|nr:hypothetical protein HDE_00605 [Halotydeus destructor]
MMSGKKDHISEPLFDLKFTLKRSLVPSDNVVLRTGEFIPQYSNDVWNVDIVGFGGKVWLFLCLKSRGDCLPGKLLVKVSQEFSYNNGVAMDDLSYYQLSPTGPTSQSTDNHPVYEAFLTQDVENYNAVHWVLDKPITTDITISYTIVYKPTRPMCAIYRMLGYTAVATSKPSETEVKHIEENIIPKSRLKPNRSSLRSPSRDTSSAGQSYSWMDMLHDKEKKDRPDKMVSFADPEMEVHLLT